ncbi:hypothetical protein V8G54_009391 [Vigna mungo]|uniref:Ubiquitin-like protease family profile domain-containing protein n=1 Tax=Vigna mungo TaxID=3915 RepID=A0AAQ3NUQ3_VIGMU
MTDARRVFDHMPNRNMDSWLLMMQGYANNTNGDDALQLFEQMNELGLEITSETIVKHSQVQQRINTNILGFTIYITFNDVSKIIAGDKMLNISIIQLWCMYMDTVIVDQGRSSVYGFVEPQTVQRCGNTVEIKQNYLQTWMAESNRDIYLVPYIDGTHWQLVVLIPKKNTVVFFCSLQKRMKDDLKFLLQG